MIDDKILDEVLPVPTMEQLRARKEAELRDEGFVVTNFAPGGIFYHLMMICFKIRIELVHLLRLVLNNMFVAHADDGWLELKAADFSKTKKAAVKTKGTLVLSREQPGEAVKIPKGQVFKTVQDINGDELRYYSTEDAVLQKDALACQVSIEAEKEGAAYNVPGGQVTRSLIHLEGIDAINNLDDWIVQEGADTEDLESFRKRVLGSWAELSTMPTRDKYKNVCEGVEGVLYVNVDDRHPRGQGTVDIIVTGTAGQASEGLLELVRKAAETIRGPYDDLLVRSSQTVTQDVHITVTVPGNIETDGWAEIIQGTIIELFRISSSRNLNELIHADIIHRIKTRYPDCKNVKVTAPAEDLYLDADKVILLGTVTVTMQKG